jgi:putative ABC transport system permease protein
MAEVAVALVLLAGAGLMVRSLVGLSRVDLGFDPSNVLVGTVNTAPTRFPDPARLETFYDGLLREAGRIPGIQAAALTSVLPFGGDTDVSFEIEGRPPARDDAGMPVAWYRLVSERYFDVMRMRLVAGRRFTRSEQVPCLLVNETMARRYWPGENPVGRRIRQDSDMPWVTIVGVVADAKSRGPASTPQVEMFIPYWFMPERGASIMLRVRDAPLQYVAALKGAVRAADPMVPLANVASLESMRQDTVAEPRFYTVLFAAFAIAGLALAAIGIAGVIAYTVSQRRGEIGVRVALGASGPEVLGLVLRDGLRMSLAGALLGTAGAAGLARLLSSLLFGVTPADPLTYLVTASLVCIVSLVASYLPARAALKVDPVEALRVE